MQAVKTSDIGDVTRSLFDVDLYPTQEMIVRDIGLGLERRMIVNTYTQYGKSFSIGVGLALRILGSSESLDIGLLGPSKSDGRNVRDALLEAGLESDLFRDLIDTGAGGDPDDLLKSASKDVLTFDDGRVRVEVMSAASGSSGKGSGLMGSGVDLLVMDESNRVPESVWRDAGDRLLNSYDSVLVEAGNPRHQGNQFFEHFQDPMFRKYHVGEHSLDEYGDAVLPENCHTASGLEEGRHGKRFFDEKAGNVGGRDSVRYTWKYKSVFPDEVEGGLFSSKWLRQAQDLHHFIDTMEREVRYGLDVAGMGDDLIVLTRTLYYEGKYFLTDQWCRKRSSDTRETADWADSLVKDDIDNISQFVVDYTGIGGGVWSALKQMGYSPTKFKAGESPDAESDKYVNKKARNYFKLRDILQDGDMAIGKGFENPDMDMPSNKLMYELGHIRREPGRRDKDKVVDPDDGSPDFADSLMMTVYESNRGFVL
jgi:hypothetical protein